jgi:hypothetical protein
LPDTLFNAYVPEKNGYYVNNSARDIGAVYVDGSGNPTLVMTDKRNLRAATALYAENGDGLRICDDGGNLGIFVKDGGNIGVKTTDVETWTTYGAIEFYNSSIAFFASNPRFFFSNNAYYDGSWKYKTTDQASQLYMNEAGNILFRTVSSGTIDTAITWESKLKIDNVTDSIGIGGYAGDSNRDSYFYFATDTYIFWDESESELNLIGANNFKIDGATDSIGIGGYAGGSNRDSYFYFASDTYIFWDESESKMIVNIAGTNEFAISGRRLDLGGAAGGSDQNSSIFFASNGQILWDEANEGFRFNNAGSADIWIGNDYLGGGYPAIGMGGYYTSSNEDTAIWFATDASIFWDESDDAFEISKDWNPIGAGGIDSGNATVYWNEINAKDFTDRSAIWIEDPDQAYKRIKNAKNEESLGFCAKVEARGQNRLKYSAFPEYCWDSALQKIEKNIDYNDIDVIVEQSFNSQNREIPKYKKGDRLATKGEMTRLRVKKKTKKNKETGEDESYNEISIAAEGFSLSAGISINMGAIKKLIQKVENQEQRITNLEGT